MEIHEDGGELSVRLPGEITDQDILFDIPSHLFPSPYDYELALKNNKIEIRYKTAHVSEEQDALFSLMLEIYNQTDKIKHHRQNFFYQLYKQTPELVMFLRQARKDQIDKVAYDYLLENQDDAYLIHSFMKTRVLGLKSHADEPIRRVIMPLVDCLNHHNAGAVFRHDTDKAQNRLVILASRPLDGSDECFAFYGPNDSLDSFLAYNYVEKSSPFLRSVPLEIDLDPIGKLYINCFSGAPTHDSLPDSVRDLKFYIPNIKIREKDKAAVLSFILVPGEKAPRALRRTLRFIIELMHTDLPPAQMAKFIKICEDEILRANTAYYNALQAMLAQNKTQMPQHICTQLEEVVELQQGKLTTYRETVAQLS